MNPLFENKKDLFYLQNQTLGFASLHIGEKVTVKVPVWQKIDTYSREKVIEGYRIITGIIKKIPKNPTPRSFVEIEVDNKQTVKVTLNNFRKIDNKNCYLFGNETDFVTEVYAELGLGKEHNKRKVLALAKIYGIEDETVIKELYETAVFNYLKVMYTYDDVRNDYYTTVEMYNRQMTLSHRTSNSILLQQYSTPAPIAYLAGAYIRKTTTEHSLFFEPSAGNGLLTLALPELQTIVNEIDKNRYSNLKQFHNFRKISNIDASKPISHENKFDGIVTNPPFGKITTEKISGYNISKLEHIMSIRALDTMKNSGRASIIVGGHTEWDQYGRVQMGSNRIFLSYLYHYYNVEDIINISGSMYSKQGTTFPIRLILINGRKITPNGTAPLKTDKDITVKSFDELWQRMSVYFDKKKRPGNERLRLLEIEMEKEIAIMDVEKGLGNNEIVITGEFGRMYFQFQHKPKEAIKFLKEVKGGECISALYRPDIGDIDIIWGHHNEKTDNGMGLCHIIKKHGKEIKALGFEVEDFITLVVQNGTFNEIKSNEDKYIFENSTFRFVIKRKWNGKKKVFLLTSFDRVKRKKG